MSKRFLGIGEGMVELSPEGGGLWRQSYAGDVLNTLWYARAALDSSCRVDFHTGLGRDVLSNEFEKFLASNGIDLGDSLRSDVRTLGLYAIHLDKGERSFSYWRDNSAARLLARDQARLARRVAGADLVYVSGITLAILSPDDLDVLIDTLKSRRAGSCFAFDPNIRPRLWADADTMRDAIVRAAAEADIVLPGLDDEALVFGEGSAETVANRYLAGGARQVVVKDGGGQLLVRGDVTLDISLETIGEPLDTTGAGDAFAGAYLAGVLADMDAKKALLRAHACASHVVMSRGALCPHDELGFLDADG